MLALTLASAAFAASHEISFDIGWIGSQDPAYGLYSGGSTLPSLGLRAGFKVHDRVALVAGWQHGVQGAAVHADGDDSYYGYYDDGGGGSFVAALYTDQLSVGTKADVKVWKWLHPYATVQAVGMRGLVRFDDDGGDDENLTQTQRAALTGGVEGALGLDFLIHVKGRVAIAPYLEMGYGWLAPLSFEEIGTLQFSGFSGHSGVGVRF